MKTQAGDVVEVWTGAALGSPFPPPEDATWAPARVVEVRGDSAQVEWIGRRPGMPIVPPAAIRKHTARAKAEG